MITYFTDDIHEKAERQRKKCLFIYLIILGAYLISSGCILAWYMTLPYMSPKISTVKWVQYPLTVVFVILSFIYLAIPYKRVNKYCKLCRQLKTGLREKFTGRFFEYSEGLESKDGVDCKSLIFIEWNKYKNTSFERKVLVFYELPFPQIPIDATLSYVTQGNVLIEYEILELPEEQSNESNSDSNR